MKRHWCIPALAAAYLLAAGCGEASVPEEPLAHIGETVPAGTELTAAAEQTTTAEQTVPFSDTAETAAETAAYTDTEAPAETTAAVQPIGEPVLLPALMERIRAAGAVTLECTFGESLLSVQSREVICGKQYLKETETAGICVSRECCDGQTDYTVDDDSKCYTAYPHKEKADAMQYLYLSEAEKGSFAGSGTDAFGGTECRFEDYSQSLGETTGLGSVLNFKQTVRLFFDENGEIVGLGYVISDKVTLRMKYTAAFAETADAAQFLPPDDYREVTRDELNRIRARRNGEGGGRPPRDGGYYPWTDGYGGWNKW